MFRSAFVFQEIAKIVRDANCYKMMEIRASSINTSTLDARGLLVHQQQGASERVVLVGETPLAQAVKSFEHADPITLPFISPEAKFEAAIG